MFKRLRTLLITALAGLAFAGTAHATGGKYVFDGGTAAEQANVKKALDTSAFDWSVVPKTIKIHIKKDVGSAASPGDIWLDSGLVDSGRYAWGTIMHEYGHQVDFMLLDDAKRNVLAPLLGGKSWWQTGSLAHGDMTCERFASTVAWSYWPSSDNTMKPGNKYDEAGKMAPAKFRKLMAKMLGVPDKLTKAKKKKKHTK